MVNLLPKLEKNKKRINAKVDHPISIENVVNRIDHIKKEKKTKIKKREARGRAKTLASIGRWMSDDEESRSSDESFTIPPSKKSSFSRSSSRKSTRKPSHKCLMAKVWIAMLVMMNPMRILPRMMNSFI